jgi:hypothetical protein
MVEIAVGLLVLAVLGIGLPLVCGMIIHWLRFRHARLSLLAVWADGFFFVLLVVVALFLAYPIGSTILHGGL